MMTNKGLNDYIALLNSPDMVPDINGAAYIFGPLLSVVSNLVAYAGIIATAFLLLRIALDVVIMAGGGSLIPKNAAGKMENLHSFGKDMSDAPVGDPLEYVKKFGWKIIVMFAFTGTMISGLLLPLAGTATATVGAVVAKAAHLNPAPYIESINLDKDTIERALGKSSLTGTMKQYNIYVANMATAKQQAEKGENLTKDEYDNIARAYNNNYEAAEMYSRQLKKMLRDARARGSGKEGTPLTKEEEVLMNFNMNAHKQQLDALLRKRGNDSTLNGYGENFKTD